MGVPNRWARTETLETDFLCKANSSTFHYVLASFVLFHFVRPLKVSFIVGKGAGYLRMYRLCLLKLIKYAHDL